MMRRRFRRRRTSQWIYADNNQLVHNSGAANFGPYYFSSQYLLPPGRTKYLCDTAKRDHLSWHGCHLWLDWYVDNHSGAQQKWPTSVGYYIMATEEASNGGAAIFQATPFTPPSAPGTIAAWDDFPDDGLNRFLWSHFIQSFGPPNSVVRTQDLDHSPNEAGNQSVHIGEGNGDFDGDGLACRTFRVAADWQPDVRVKSRVRLRPNEGIAIVAFTPYQPVANMDIKLSWAVRHLGR